MNNHSALYWTIRIDDAAFKHSKNNIANNVRREVDNSGAKNERRNWMILRRMEGVRGFAGEISIGFMDFGCDAGASEAPRKESRKSNDLRTHIE